MDIINIYNIGLFLICEISLLICFTGIRNKKEGFMYNSKRFFNNDGGYKDGNKVSSALFNDILSDEEFILLDEVIIGCWGDVSSESSQEIIDNIVVNKDRFSKIKSLFIGDINYYEYQVWDILQGDYTKFWEAMPQLEKLIIKGSQNLVLGNIIHVNLKHFEIICAGLPSSVIKDIKKAELPALETFLLDIGIDEYGFDGNMDNINSFLAESYFPNLKCIGFRESHYEDEIAGILFNSKYISQITTISLANGLLGDRGGQIVLDGLIKYPNIKKVDLHHHSMSANMLDQLEEFACKNNIEIDISECQKPDAKKRKSRSKM